jgi:hypothetical protein
MQHLNTLTQVLNAASAVSDLARKTVHYQFAAVGKTTVYTHIDSATLKLIRTTEPQVTLEGTLQPPFAWRLAVEQDEAGIYLVALRKAAVGSIATATFALSVPASAHLILRLEHATLALHDASGTIELPAADDGLLRIQPVTGTLS